MDSTHQLREDAAACDFVAQFVQDRERGVVRDLAAYQACFPEFGARIANEHAILLTGMQGPGAAPPLAGREIGPYRLLERLGHGGQGIVFRAEHRELHRIVALKMLHRGVLGLSAAHRARLRREAITVARLEHPGICPVYEVELEGDEPYLAMRFVPGRSLASELEQARQARRTNGLPPQQREQIEAWLAFFERAAQAVHAAHEAGIVHRDIKPHNLMRMPDGEPVLLDFGLARDVTSTSAALTQSHELFGTLAYMAPELLDGKAEPNPRHDVYALAATIYETLTLQQPFAAATPEALWRRIESGDVTAPSLHNPHLPREVDVVLATAMERDPARRYPTAHALAEDLRRLRLREPILARPLRRTLRARRWVRRHPVFSMAFVLLATGFAVVLGLLGTIARSNAELLRSNRGLLALQRSHQALALSEVNPTYALREAIAATHMAHLPEIANNLLRVLDRCYQATDVDFRALVNGVGACSTIAGDPNGDLVAIPYLSGEVFVVEAGTGRIAARIAAHPPGRTLAVFTAGVRQLLTTGVDGVLRRWCVGDAAPARQWACGTTAGGVEPGNALAVTADGSRVAWGGAAGSIRIVDVTGDAPPVSCRGHTKNVSFVAFDPSGGRLLSFSRNWYLELLGDNSVRTFDTRTGKALSVFAEGRFVDGVRLGAPRHAAWSADGAVIAIALDVGGVFVVRGAIDGPGAFLVPGGTMAAVAFDPRRPRIVMGGDSGLAVYDYDRQQVIWKGEDFGDRQVTQVAFRPDGDEFAVMANDSTARIHDAATLVRRRTLVLGSRPGALRWSTDGTRLEALTASGLRSHFADVRPFLPRLEGHTDRVVQVHFDASGTRVVSASRDGTARVWDSAQGGAVALLEHHRPVRTARFSAGGDRVVTTSEGGATRLWTLRPMVATAIDLPPAMDAWFCDGDRRVVTIDDQGWIRSYEATAGVRLGGRRVHDAKIECAAWHPTRPWLATGANGRVVSVFDCVSHEEVFRSTPWPWTYGEGSGRKVLALTFTPDGATVFAGGEDMFVHGWRLDTGASCSTASIDVTPGFVVCGGSGLEVFVAGLWSPALHVVGPGDEAARMTGHRPGNVASSLRMDASGRRLLCADKSGRVAVFAVEPWRELLTIRASEVPVLDAEFSPDGASIVTGDAAGQVRIWPVDPLPVAERYCPLSLEREPR